MQLISYPARPVNGGKLDKARRKFGVWAYEPKANGWRAVLHLPTGTMWNRHGELLSIASTFTLAVEHLRQALADLPAVEWLDVEAMDRRHEMMRGSLIVLDAIVAGVPYQQRRIALESRLWLCRPECNLGIGQNEASLIKSFPAESALMIYGELQRQNDRLSPDWHLHPLNCFWEGVVAKEVTSHYPLQIRSSTETFGHWMKHRFV